MFHRKRRPQSSRLHASSASVVEALEGRTLLSTFMVTNHRDVGPGSLRDDIQQSNNTPGPNTIVFAAGFTGTITLTGTQLEISSNVTITGPGASSLAISGGGMSRVFQIDVGAAVSISGLTISGGQAASGAGGSAGTNTAPNGQPGGPGADGGGVYNLGSLTLSQDVIAANAAGMGGTGGAGIVVLQNGFPVNWGDGGKGGAAGNGGGIYSSGSLIVLSCMIDNNSAGIGGTGGTYAGAGGSPGPGGAGGNGGGIYAASGSVVIIASTISSNHTGNAGNEGGPTHAPPGPFGPVGSGGAIYSMTQLNLANTTVSGNMVGIGSGFHGTPGAAASAIDGSGTWRLTNCTISGNNASGSTAGAVVIAGTAVVDNTIISGNVGTVGPVPGSPPIDVSGALDASSSYNVIGNGGGLTNGANGNFVGIKAPLSPLGNYGGPTQTMLPLPGNFAIGHGSIALAAAPDGAALATDQRGLPRTSNGTIDIGAAEVGPPSFPLIVTTTADNLDTHWAPNNLSFREAAGFASTIGGSQSITFAPGVTGTIALNSSLGAVELNDMNGAVVIHGPGALELSVSGAALVNDGVQVQIDSLGLADISNSGTMNLVRCRAATIGNGGTLTATACIARGLALGDNSDIVNCTIIGSAGSDQVRPGGILRACTIQGVQVINYNHSTNAPTLIDCVITGPVATAGTYGLVMNTSGCALTLIGCTISGSSVTAVANLGGPLTLTRRTLTGNSALSSNGLSGGALFNAGPTILDDCTISNDVSIAGGGVFNATLSELRMTDCTILDNRCTAGTGQSGGGGIENAGTLTLSGCTITGNACVPATGKSPAAIGAGIDNSGTASLFNCTVSGNTVSTGSATAAFVTGGGIENSGTLRMTNCSVSGNTANAGAGAENDAAGGGIYTTGGHVFLNNTLVAANNTVDPNGVFSPDIGGAVDAASAYNLVSAGDGMTGLTAANHNQIGTAGSPIDAKLAALANNGGPTQTMALLPVSPAIDAGSNALAIGPDGKPLIGDQRGFGRIFNGTVDIGAYEFGASLLGDADRDGKVDFADVVLVVRHYGMNNATWSDGDFNNDGSVGFDDLLIVARNYGRSVSLAAADAAMFSASVVGTGLSGSAPATQFEVAGLPHHRRRP